MEKLFYFSDSGNPATLKLTLISLDCDETRLVHNEMRRLSGWRLDIDQLYTGGFSNWKSYELKPLAGSEPLPVLKSRIHGMLTRAGLKVRLY